MEVCDKIIQIGNDIENLLQIQVFDPKIYSIMSKLDKIFKDWPSEHEVREAQDEMFRASGHFQD